MELNAGKLEEYLSSVYNAPTKVVRWFPLGKREEEAERELKGFGYGVPYVIEFKIGKETGKVVLETMHSDGFGHEHFSDRARIMLWQYSTFGKLPKHVPCVDVGALTTGGQSLRSLSDCREFFTITEFVDGSLYHDDLDRIMDTGRLKELDEKRCLALSDYLAAIHSVRGGESGLYLRRIRELVGHGECIMGLLDSYPSKRGFYNGSDFVGIEHECVDWRWRLKNKANRLCQVHGDFHPWNVMFREGATFTVLDRSRGEWGEAADDVAAMTINYIFYSLRKYGELAGVFERLFRLFLENYLRKTGDRRILEVIQPFYAWRGLVVASPIWYPDLKRGVRMKLLNFVRNVLRFDQFDFGAVNSYLGRG